MTSLFELWLDAIKSNPDKTLEALLAHSVVYPDYVDDLLKFVEEKEPDFVNRFRMARTKFLGNLMR